MPTPLRRVGGPLEGVARQDGWRLAEGGEGAASRGSGCCHAPSPPSGILAQADARPHSDPRGHDPRRFLVGLPAEIWRAMIVSVVLLGRSRRCCGHLSAGRLGYRVAAGYLPAGAGLGLAPRLVRNHRIFSVAILILPSRRSRRARLAPWEGPKYPIIRNRR
jgi:hypothetical protein